MIQREFDAINRDLEWERGWKGVAGRSLDECMEHWQQYPSILSRFDVLLGSIYRGKENILDIPYKVKNFIHRGRYGWATPDTWSMEYTLAKQLDGVFTEFLKVNIAHPIDMTEDSWNAVLIEIRDGFRAYHEFQDKAWSNGFSGDTFEDSIKWEREAYDDAERKVQNSLKLMAQYYTQLSW